MVPIYLLVISEQAVFFCYLNPCFLLLSWGNICNCIHHSKNEDGVDDRGMLSRLNKGNATVTVSKTPQHNIKYAIDSLK